jgi:hypothetical protein
MRERGESTQAGRRRQIRQGIFWEKEDGEMEGWSDRGKSEVIAQSLFLSVSLS